MTNWSFFLESLIRSHFAPYILSIFLDGILELLGVLLDVVVNPLAEGQRRVEDAVDHLPVVRGGHLER